MSEDPYEDDDLDEDDERDADESLVTIEISGLSLFTHHGVTGAEQEVGQRLVVDLRMEVAECDATVTDRVEDTVDYGEVCQFVALVAQGRSYRTLERLCAVLAERILEEFAAESVEITCAKPEPPIPLAVDEVSVRLFRER